MKAERLSLSGDAAAIHIELRAEYLAQLVAPMDDMWAAFADMATPHALFVGDKMVGSCCVDDQAQLLRFWVRPHFQQHSDALLRLVLRELGVTQMMVSTIDPVFLSAAIDLADKVETHTLLFAHLSDPEGPNLAPLVVAAPDDLERIVDFEAAAIGAPREFLDAYVSERLERREILLFERDSQLACVGELRRDRQQEGIAQLGVIVGVEERGQGLASRMLVSLVQRANELRLTPHCSTEITNVGARRAIERAGFRATHRMLRVTPDRPQGS